MCLVACSPPSIFLHGFPLPHGLVPQHCHSLTASIALLLYASQITAQYHGRI